MDPNQREMQNSSDRRREIEDDLRHALIRNKDPIIIESDIRDRVIDEEVARESSQPLSEQIWQAGQELYDLLLKSHLPASEKENWIERLSSKNWKAAFQELRQEAASHKSAFFAYPHPLDPFPSSEELDIVLGHLDSLILRQEGLNMKIEDERQEVLKLLRERNLSPLDVFWPPLDLTRPKNWKKEDWIRRLSSKNWRSELRSLRQEIDYYQEIDHFLPQDRLFRRIEGLLSGLKMELLNLEGLLSGLKTKLLNLEGLVSRE